jgi:DNA repair photolyase
MKGLEAKQIHRKILEVLGPEMVQCSIVTKYVHALRFGEIDKPSGKVE